MLLLLTQSSLAAVLPPHSGYHMRGRALGFEGWYHRLVLPDAGDFAFIYSIFDPADAKSPRHRVLMVMAIGIKYQRFIF